MDLHVYRNSQDRWHDLRTSARERGAVLASNAVTLDELVQRLTPDVTPASPGQRLVLVEFAVRNRVPVRYAYDAISDLKAAGVSPAELRQAGADELADILDVYDRRCRETRVVDPHQRRWLAASRVEATPWFAQFDSVVLHALYDLADADFILLRNIIERAPGGGVVMLFNTTSNVKPTQFAEWTWQRFIRDESLAEKTVPDFFRSASPAADLLERLFVFSPSDPSQERLRPNGALQIVQCGGRYREIESIGSDIAELLDQGADPNEIAVVVRHIDTYGEMIEDVFNRYSIEHTFETGVPLLRIPFIKYWMALLDLVVSDRSRDAMARILASAYYQPRLTPALDPDRVLTEIGYIDRRHLKASALAARRHSELTGELERLETLLDRIEAASATPMAFLDQLQPASVLSDRDRQAWRTLVEEIEAVDPLIGEVPFTNFRTLVSEIAGLRTIDRFTGTVAAPGIPRVRVVMPRALGYRSYKWIFAPGFVDGEIPAPAAANPLLDDEVLEALNRKIRPRRILSIRDRNRKEPLYLFMLLDSGSERVTLTCPASTLEGEPIYPSIYVGEILRHYDPPPIRLLSARSPRESGEYLRETARVWRNDLLSDLHVEELLGPDLVRRVRWEQRGIERSDLGQGTLPMEVVWHPSELNALSACPFTFLAKHRLKIRPPELPDFEVSSRELGSLAHQILREFYSKPVPASESDAIQRMQEVIDRHLAAVDINGQGPNSVIDPSLWRISRPQLVRALIEYVRFAVRDAGDGFETLQEYLDRSLPAAKLGEITLGGRPDHIAVRRTAGRISGIRVDDFKYSAASSSTNSQLQRSFQVPVYAHLTAAALQAEPDVTIEGRYLLLRSPSKPVVAREIDSESIDDVRRRIDELLEKVKNGWLHPDPPDKSICATCEYRRMCRLYGG